MNVYDSDRIVTALSSLGYHDTDAIETADLIIANTCTIREKAEQKAFSFLGRLAKMKHKNNQLIIGVGGCMAQQEGGAILKRMPHIDFVFGTQAIDRVPVLVERIENKRCRIVDIELTDTVNEIEPVIESQTVTEVSRFVTIMRGCDNFCTYCVVPYVRGREISRKPRHIVDEIKALVRRGVKEVTLLGQNVNSYGLKQRLGTFPELLMQIGRVEGLQRIRFTTSHPKDLSDELIDAWGTIEKLCRHIHLPVQSGSSRVLKRMHRKYSREHYLERIAKIRETCPGIGITSDIMVGFPGETAEDFEQTLDLIRQVEFDSLFAFKYSDRPQAPSRKYVEKVSERVKSRRLREVFDLQTDITTGIHHRMQGRVETILVEGFSKKHTESGGKQIQWSGRTSCNKIVNFIKTDFTTAMDNVRIGEMVDVRIEKAFPHSLWGRALNRCEAIRTAPLKGETCYAA